MRSRWTDAEAAALEGVDLLVYASRLIGAETSLVVWGGGNTSVKVIERDHRGREIPVLRVKGSGSDLKSIQRRDFPGVRMDDIRALLERQDMGDEEMVAYLAHALQDPGGVRPSIETLLHGFVHDYAVVHTHADAIVALTNNDRAADVLAGVYGKDVIALDYRRPGFRISREVADAIAAHPEARALLLSPEERARLDDKRWRSVCTLNPDSRRMAKKGVTVFKRYVVITAAAVICSGFAGAAQSPSPTAQQPPSQQPPAPRVF